MNLELLERLKKSDKSIIDLVFDADNRRILVQKRLQGEFPIYKRLLDLPHPFLPKLYDVHTEDGETLVLEEYIAGGSIAGINTSEKQLRKWLLELCEVLQHLHKNGIVHRDIKPSNLLIGADGHIRLIDFDAAREPKKAETQDTQLLGTRGYAPPEQYGFSQTDERADIYALGVTFRELLGKAAGKGRWKRILRRCTALEPKRRYRHVWMIPVAIRAEQARRYVFRPALALYVLCVVSLMTWLNITESITPKEWLDVFINRRYIFRNTEIAEIKRSNSTLPEYHGDLSASYQLLTDNYSDLIFIASGYADGEGNPLFGGFEYTYRIADGTLQYRSFAGLYAVKYSGEVYCIPPEEYAAYSPAILHLYRLDTFDTPLF